MAILPPPYSELIVATHYYLSQLDSRSQNEKRLVIHFCITDEHGNNVRMEQSIGDRIVDWESVPYALPAISALNAIVHEKQTLSDEDKCKLIEETTLSQHSANVWEIRTYIDSSQHFFVASCGHPDSIELLRDSLEQTDAGFKLV